MVERPGVQAMTSEQLRQRADRRRDIAVGIRAQGGQVREEYE
jgi:hypothetical protein